MIQHEIDYTYPTAVKLVEDKVASRIAVKDASLYDFDDNASEFAKNFMGWTDLASNPPCDTCEIQKFAKKIRKAGLRDIVLIGQGGSTQAPMTLTKYNKPDSTVTFRTLDSVSPLRVRSAWAACDLEKTLFIVSSKSGGTIEPMLILNALKGMWQEDMPDSPMNEHLIAITDPGSDLEQRAIEEKWLKVFSGEPTVGGRYSALSVFGLVPAALAGIDIVELLASAAEAEVACSADEPENPAIQLASFLFDNYLRGRDKFAFVSPKRGRVLGLWIEQLIAESVGKDGDGILPQIEINPLSLSVDPMDRVVIEYSTKVDSLDERINLAKTMEFIHPNIPYAKFSIEDVTDLAGHFVMWEYATAMLGYLMKVCPFDQPDVQIAKTTTLRILREGETLPDYTVRAIGNLPVGKVKIRLSGALEDELDYRDDGDDNIEDMLEVGLRALFGSIRTGDYFSLNAFIPFAGEGRREALEAIRHAPVAYGNVASCLEIGPRYLHSTGQLQKGGSNNGVYLILSADEPIDIELTDPRAKTLGQLAASQALGDFTVLSERGRRAMHIHLPDHCAATLRSLAEVAARAASPRCRCEHGE